MTQRRIALVSEHASPLATLGGVDAGGQNVHVAALATELAIAGCEVTVYTRRDSALLPRVVTMADGVDVVHVDAGPARPVPKDELLPYMAQFGRELRRAWQRRRPDVVHSHFWMSGWASIDAARAVGAPLVHTFHALGVVKRRHQATADTSPPQRESVERAVLRASDAIVATCSDELRELRLLGGHASRIHVVPCGVDTRRFTPAPRRARGRRRTRIVSLGRLVPRKGVDDVVRALARVPDAELVIAGGPPAGGLAHDPEVTRLRAIASSTGVAARVRFLGAVPRDAVPALLRSADVVTCTPWYEPFGIVPLEAAACGVPVVATAVGGQLDTIVDGETGLLVPARQPGAIATALQRLVTDPALRARLGARAAARAHASYGWATVADATLDVYDRVRTDTEVVPA